MTITSEDVQRVGSLWIVTVTSDLVDPTFFWYVDGVYVKSETSGVYTLSLGAGDQVRVEAIDTTDPDSFDPFASAPDGYSSRISLVFDRPIDDSVYRYVATYTDLDIIPLEPVVFFETLEAGQWQLHALTPPLKDVGRFEFSVYSYDVAGNVTPVPSTSRYNHVRTPDAPDFDISYDDGTGFVTFSEV